MQNMVDGLINSKAPKSGKGASAECVRAWLWVEGGELLHVVRMQGGARDVR